MKEAKRVNFAAPAAGLLLLLLAAELVPAFLGGGAKAAAIQFLADLAFLALGAAILRLYYELSQPEFLAGTALFTLFFHLALFFGGYSINAPGYLLFLRTGDKRTLAAMVVLPLLAAAALFFVGKRIPQRLYAILAAAGILGSLAFRFVVYTRNIVDADNHFALVWVLLLLCGTVALAACAAKQVVGGGRDKMAFAVLFILLFAATGPLILPGGLSL